MRAKAKSRKPTRKPAGKRAVRRKTDAEILAELPPLTASEKRRLIEEGLAESRSGLGVPHDEVMAWLASLATAKPLPRPKPRKLGPVGKEG
jgi:predicted transcriptional regulator